MANMLAIVFSVALLVVLQTSSINAGDCKNYRIIVTNFTTCKGVKSLATPENISLDLRDDCKLYSKGCVSFGAFNTATVSFWGAPTRMPMLNVSRSNINGCEQMTGLSVEAKAIMEAMKVPTSCPVKEGKVCSDESRFIDLSSNTGEMDKAMGFPEGRFHGKFDAKLDTGRICYRVAIQILNPNKPKSALPGVPSMKNPLGMFGKNKKPST